MDEVSRHLPVVVRAAVPGEGIAIASLWRELWEASKAWGGYPASHDSRTYAELGQRIDASLGLRTGQTVSSRDIHLVADIGGLPCGQVEGVVDRHGADPATPFSCDVRSLIVTRAARGKGAGRALLGALANAAMTVTGGTPCVLTAEVLESNPALAFYEREGFAPIGHCARVQASWGASLCGESTGHTGARIALPPDALSVARLDGVLAARLRAAGDLRVDDPATTLGILNELGRIGSENRHGCNPPKITGGSRLGPLASHFRAHQDGRVPNVVTLVSVDGRRSVLGAALFAIQPLEPPFVPMCRAGVGRVALFPASPIGPAVTSLVALASRLALDRGAPYLEISDLPAPGTELYDGAMAVGAAPWSRVVARLAERDA
jgi:GNAT superfamily N-acetyltransferase